MAIKAKSKKYLVTYKEGDNSYNSYGPTVEATSPEEAVRVAASDYGHGPDYEYIVFEVLDQVELRTELQLVKV